MNESHLDLNLLENIRHRGDDVISGCPACQEIGKDTARDNLRIYNGGPYICIAYPKEREHNRRIFALVGVRGEKALDPVAKRQWRERRARQRQRERDASVLKETVTAHREQIIARWEWDRTDVWESSPQRIDCPLVEFDPRHFLASLFSDAAVVWTGECHETGQNGIHASHWKTVADWQHAPRVGSMTAPSTWKPATTSRTRSNVQDPKYVTLDFDGIDGMKPEGQKAIDEHIRESLALIRWIREGLCWDLAAILFTGGVSLHAWFRIPPADVLDSLKNAAKTLGIDKGLIGQPEHPCRLPGQRHAKTGKLSRALWLQTPTE